ncbi:MAG: restriction endonuclease subunit S [Bacteroidaceae bacterium]|nr:restriction endonuclease subunit S [Bacteroidaceae bacterium]
MKQGWEIKKLGEVCTVERGGSPRPIDAFLTDAEDGINWIKIGDATTGSKYITATKEKIKPEGVKKSRMVYKDDFILSNSMSFGKPYILGIDGCIHDGWLVLRDSNNLFDKSFLYYYLGSPNIYREFKRLAVGGVVNNLNSELVRGVNVVIPPLIEQEKIVAELDCLSGIIEKKKQQLKEYDALAQSIFYEMFGNPIDNEKGWEMCTIDSLCSSIVRGPFGSALKKEYFIEPTQTAYKVYEQKHAIQKNAEIGTYYISAERFATLSRFEVKAGDIIMSCSGTIGELFEIPIGAEKGLMNQALLKFTLNNRIEKIYFLFAMECVKDSFDRKGTGLQNIGSVGTIKKTQISLPKISLQQEFASKIEAIEKQKELLKQSIAETETLFNSRMDYYFN